MSRLTTRFASLADANRKALTTFITAGDPAQALTVPALHALVAAGADVLELGVAFSDPEAEGPAIQAASERSLAQHTTLNDVLHMVSAFRRDDDATPVVLMGYLNSLLAMGVDTFAERAGQVGVDGVIMVNLPPEEATEIRPRLARENIDLIYLIAPTTTDARADQILEHAAGFVYYVSLKGITGANTLNLESVVARTRWLKDRTPLPVQVGFGIKDGTTARAVGAHADGVVIGSALVATMGEFENRPQAVDQLLDQLGRQVAEIRSGLDSPG